MPPSPLRVPASFRGEVHSGDEAARRASLVSGPFDARPDLYIIPRDLNDLILLVRWAAEKRVPLVPRGGGTGMPGGNVGPGVVLDLSTGFSGVGAVDRSRRTVRAGAGAVVDRVQEAALTHGLRLPALPASSPWCSVGGITANNAAGPRSLRHGSVRSRVVALEGVDARGETFRISADAPAVPREEVELPASFPALELELEPGPDGRPHGWPVLRKNASGYALDHFLPERDPVQLLVGSEGTLALITHVEFSLDPVPESRGLVVLTARDPSCLTGLCTEARGAGASACEFLGRRLLRMCSLARDPDVGSLADGAYALLLVEFEGSPDEVRARVHDLSSPGKSGGDPGIGTMDPATMDRLWSLRHRASPIIAREADRGRISTQFIEDSVVPPDELGRYLEGVDAILLEHGFDAVVFGHGGDGNVHVNPLVDVESPDWRDRVRSTLVETTELVRSLGGTLSGEHGDGRLRAPLLPRIWPEPLVEAFRRVKEAFDPDGILNPGVILPLPGQDPLDALTPRPRAFP